MVCKYNMLRNLDWCRLGTAAGSQYACEPVTFNWNTEWLYRLLTVKFVLKHKPLF